MNMNDFIYYDLFYAVENNIPDDVQRLDFLHKDVLLKEDSKLYSLNVVEVEKDCFILQKNEKKRKI